MADVDIRDIVDMAESNRLHIDEDLLAFSAYVEHNLAQGKWPEATRAHGGRAGTARALVNDAILNQLYLLLCTDDPSYREVRSKGSVVSAGAVTAVAGYIAGAYSVGLAAATGGVSFVALAVFRVGIGVFCQLGKQRLGRKGEHEGQPADVEAPTGAAGKQRSRRSRPEA